jgi:hypothetical protein
VNLSFCPADYLTQIVFSGGKSIVTAQRGQRVHQAILPHETGAYMSGGNACGSEGSATPRLAVWIESSGFGKTGDLPVIVFVWPLNVTVGAAERPEIEP